MCWSIYGLQTVTEQGTYERHEQIDAVPFDYTAHLCDGAVEATWAVDGQLVDESTYEERMKRALEKQATQHDRERMLWRDAAMQRVRGTVWCAELGRLKRICEHQLEKLYDAALTPYWAFKSETIDSDTSLESVKRQLVPALDFAKEAGAAEIPVAVLKKLAEQASELYERLVLLYADTIEIACTQASDTATLKKLLECGS